MNYHSQAGQDEWVHSLIGDTGYFVDVGAHDGIVHSNTYALEQLGWTGICLEPNSVAFRDLRENRKCEAWMVAASSQHGVMSFDGVRMIPDPLTGPIVVTTVTLNEVCERVVPPAVDYLMGERVTPPTIDYLSIDVEGHELEVLAGMDFDRWHVRCATIEHNAYCDGPARKDAIAAVMLGHGFECFADDVVAPGYGEYESWWIHRDG